MSPFWLLPAVMVAVAVGAYVERFRWLRWMERHHPDEIDTTWL